jgi:hypothetical protein
MSSYNKDEQQQQQHKQQPMRKRTKGAAGETVDMRVWRRSPERAEEWGNFVADEVAKHEDTILGSIRSDEVASLLDEMESRKVAASSSSPSSSSSSSIAHRARQGTPEKIRAGKRVEQREAHAEEEPPAATSARDHAPPHAKKARPEESEAAIPCAARMQHRRPREDDDCSDDSSYSAGYSACSDREDLDADAQDYRQPQTSSFDGEDERAFLAVEMALMNISDTLPSVDFLSHVD